MYVTRLEDRSVFSLSGKDTVTFLQGIVTNDVEALNAGTALYTALLTPQGKFLDDFFLAPAGEMILADCNKTRQEALIRRLSMYKLRADVAIEARDDLAVLALFPAEDAPPPDIANATVFADPRHRALGVRIIAPADAADDIMAALEAEIVEAELYAAVRMEMAIAEGGSEIGSEQSYPLEFGLDRLHAISFTKGCYVGQEVTARMNTRKLVKRQPASVTTDAELAAGAPLMLDGKKIGEVLSAGSGRGIALIENTAHEALRSGEKPSVGDSSATVEFPDWAGTENG